MLNTATVTIKPKNQSKFEAKLAKLNRLAAKLGLNQFESSAELITVEDKNEYGDGIKAEMVQYTLTGEVPVIGGWSVIARLEHGENNIMFSHEELPEVYRTRHECDHCNTVRNRTVSYVLKQGDKYMQVGGNCISYYLPKDFEDLARFYKDISESEDCDFSNDNFGGGEYGVGTLQFLQVAQAAVKKFGYKKTIEDFSTADLVLKYILDWKNRDKIGLTPTESDMVDAYNTVAWLYEQPNTDYFYNCRAICSRDFVTYKTAGILASAAYVYRKSLEQKKANVFLGEVGKKYELTLTVVSRQYIDSYYGSTLIRFVDADGNKYSWFASNSQMEVGQTFNVKATVKAHDTKFDCTVLTRVTKGK